MAARLDRGHPARASLQLSSADSMSAIQSMSESNLNQFRRGVELFNAGKFFECHEVWETVWLKAEGEEREFLHAMIQAAAALHHVQRGNLKGARSVGRRAIDRLGRCPAMVMQLDVRAFCLSFESFLAADNFPTPRIELKL